MILYNVTDEYINFLSTADRKVLSSHQADRSFERPHSGVVIENSCINYFIPLSSPDNQDYINGQIRNSTTTIKRLIAPQSDFVGKLLINNMIPVPTSEIIPIDMDTLNKTPEEIRYINLLQKQLQVIRSRQEEINKSANVVYLQKTNENNEDYWIDHTKPGYLNATIDFKLLEEKYQEWIAAKQSTSKTSTHLTELELLEANKKIRYDGADPSELIDATERQDH